KIWVFVLAIGCLLSSFAWASPADLNDGAAFAQLKSLAGDWESAAKSGKQRLHIEVVSGGSAVVERFESSELGPENAMLTVYYLNGGRLQLTHYCMAKNQPHMQARSFDSGSGELRFDFVDAVGLSSPQAGHMHNASFRFIDPDHFSADWQFYEGGKPKFDENVQFTRVR